MITGLDLVEQQILVARGQALSFSQEDISINGHAMELRVYAEDPYDNFVPSINTLHTYQCPEGEGIRVDNGYMEGDDVPIYYDPMLAKLVVHGPNREAAIKKMLHAIQNYTIEGISSTLDFGSFVMKHPAFTSGNFDTKFVQLYWNKEEIEKTTQDEVRIAAWLGQWLLNTSDKKLKVS